MAAIRAINSSITRPLWPSRPPPAQMDAAIGAAACFRPGVPECSGWLMTADEALVPRVPPPEARAGVARLSPERPGAVVRHLGTRLAPAAGHGAPLADRAGVGARALDVRRVREGERDGVPADRARDRAGLRAGSRDVGIRQRPREAAAVLLERHGVVVIHTLVNGGDRVAAVQVPPLKLPLVAVRMARAVRTESDPAMRHRRDNRRTRHASPGDERGRNGRAGAERPEHPFRAKSHVSFPPVW